MKKKDLLVISLVCVLTMAAGVAAYANPITTSTTIGTNTSFTPSSNVQVDAYASASNYSATAQHLNGNRIFFGMNGDSKLYYITKTAGSNTTPSGTGAANTPVTAVPNSYTSL